MYISENCKWTPYGTDPRKDRLVDSYKEQDRIAAAEQGYGLDKLVYDEKVSVRAKVAAQGYGLDILVKDEHYHVRREVARQGYGLDILIDDCKFVLEEVAKHGYGLDKLVNIDSYVIRREVARQGYGLDILVNDEDRDVRLEVAKQGYGLDKLVNDTYFEVRKVVAEQGYGLDKLVYDENYEVRYNVAWQGYGLDKLVNDEERHVRNGAEMYLKNAGYKSIFDWVQDHPDKACRTSNSITQVLQDFIYKANNSNKLIVQTDCGSIDEFFNKAFTDNGATLAICAVDTKTPLIKFQKTVANTGTRFILIVDITDMYGDAFTINSIIISHKQLNACIQQTIEILRADRQLNKYADDLEDCLSVAS